MGIINGSMPCSPGHGDRAANATAANIDHGENARLGAGLHRATGAIRAAADAHDPFSPYLYLYRVAPAIRLPGPMSKSRQPRSTVRAYFTVNSALVDTQDRCPLIIVIKRLPISSPKSS